MQGTTSQTGDVAENDDAETDKSFPNSSDVLQLATVAVVGIGCAATFEAALLSGFVIGVAAMVVPGYVTKIGNAPRGKSALRNGLQAVEFVASVLKLARRVRRV
jgi:hypothetical protein